MNLSTRSYQKELLDRDDIPFVDIEQNMKELNFINTHLGGHAITINACKKIIGTKKNISICEIGCGGGDNLLAIQNWCKKNNITVSFIGIDINKDCIAVANATLKPYNYQLLTCDYKLAHFDTTSPDIIFSSLFCHHFTNNELQFMLQWMQKNAGIGFFINDLHRHWLAYYSIKLLTYLFSSSYLVKNDAPLSVKRGFKKNEWVQLLQAAGVKQCTITWKWAFRWLLTSTSI